MTDLTEKTIKAAAPGDVLKDTQVKGLQLRVFPQSRAFYLYYRNQAGVQRKPKLGDHGTLTLTDARRLAREKLMAVARGEDPAAERKVARAELTLADLWDEFKTGHMARRKSLDQYQRRYTRRLKRWGARKLSDIDHAELQQYIETIGKDSPVEANMVLLLVGALFNFARKRLRLPIENPRLGIPKFAEQKRRRYMKGEEPAKIAAILDREAATQPAPVAFIYLLILSGARKSEIGGARWEWLDGNVLNLPDSKTGRKQVFLPDHAMDVIARLPRDKPTIVGMRTPDYFWQKVRVEAGCPDLRLHDLRHSFASAAIGAGFSLAQIGELLGHKNAQTTMRYAHLVDEAAVGAASVTADRIMASMKKLGQRRTEGAHQHDERTEGDGSDDEGRGA